MSGNMIKNKGITTPAEKMIQKEEGSQWPLAAFSVFLNSVAEKIPGQVYRYQHVESGIDSQDVNNS